jgi:hypothetical protein
MLSRFLVSNFFRVNDEKEFELFVRKWDLVPLQRESGGFGFRRTGKDSFGIPRAHVDSSGRPSAGDILRDLSILLADGEVAIVMENIVCPARAVIRLNAIAVKRGEQPIRLSLNQIYDLVFEKWGVVPGKIDWSSFEKTDC